MYDFDATNLLSDEKHSGFEDPFDNFNFHWKDKSDKVEKATDHAVANKEHNMKDMAGNLATNGWIPDEKKLKTDNKNDFAAKTVKHDGTKATSSTTERTTMITIGKTILHVEGSKTQQHISSTLLPSGKDNSSATVDQTTKIYLSSPGRYGGWTQSTAGVEVNFNPRFAGDKYDEMTSEDFEPILETDYYNNAAYEREFNARTSRVSPYVIALGSLGSVVLVALIILLAFLLYKRRFKKSVISDEMYNDYKLSKRIQNRSPLPSPRGSEQEEGSKYTYMSDENLSAQMTCETTISHGLGDSVYLELDEDLRYDYATVPSNTE